MSELENYLEANYSVKDVLNKAEKKRKRSNDFGEPDITKSKPKIEVNENSPKNETFHDDWINVETKEAVANNTVLGADEIGGISNKEIKDDDKEILLEKITEKSKYIVDGLRSEEKVLNTPGQPIDLLKLPAKPKKNRKNDSKKIKIENPKQEPIYRDKYGQKLHGYQPLTPKQQRKQNESEREQRIRDLNKDEYTEQLNKLNTKKEIVSKEEGSVHASEGIREDDPALLFDKSIKKSFKDSEIKQKLTSICGRKLFKDESLYPLNRFGLVPGALWDGVDRGNGYEKKWLQKQVDKSQADASRKVISNEDNSF